MKLFSIKNINFINQLFNTDGSVKNWNALKTEYALRNKYQFCWLQLIKLSKKCGKCIKQTSENTSLLVAKDHHLLRGSRIITLENSLEKLNNLKFLEKKKNLKIKSSKELYPLLYSAIDCQPTLQKLFANIFPNIELPWKSTSLHLK